VVTEGSGKVDGPGAAEHADGEVAQAGHDVGAGAGANLGGVLGEGGVAEVVQAVLAAGPAPRAEGVVLPFDAAQVMFGCRSCPMPLAPPGTGVVDTSELTEGGQAR
jgi:hypothetical protein